MSLSLFFPYYYSCQLSGCASWGITHTSTVTVERVIMILLLISRHNVVCRAAHHRTIRLISLLHDAQYLAPQERLTADIIAISIRLCCSEAPGQLGCGSFASPVSAESYPFREKISVSSLPGIYLGHRGSPATKSTFGKKPSCRDLSFPFIRPHEVRADGYYYCLR